MPIRALVKPRFGAKLHQRAESNPDILWRCMSQAPQRNCYSETEGNSRTINVISSIPINMKVTEKDVVYVAGLANLALTAEERVRLVRELNSILEYVDRLNEVDTTNVQPMAQVLSRYGADKLKSAEPFAPAGRDDILEGLRKSLPREVALANAPDTDGTFFRVPKVIER
jgi:aspartyl-tRNA(Asn)/glutamyl-tRNA(Gln) amidotransferase subunit C